MRHIILFLIVISPVNAATITAFVSPDNSFDALRDFLADAKDLKVASYTFTSADISDMMLTKNATVIVDASPVGGLTQESSAALCRLVKNGIPVYLYDGGLRFMHAKYIIKDGKEALIASENLGDDGFPRIPNHGNRGWGVIVEDETIAEKLSDVFLSDLSNSKPFVCDRNYTAEKNQPAGNYNPVFTPQRFVNQNVSLVVAPNAMPALLTLINSAHSRLLVEQFYIYRYFDRKTKSENPLLEAMINASRKGINVSVLLDSFYYNVESEDPSSNLYTNEYLNNISKTGLPLDSRLIDLSNGLLKLHNKGMIADDSVLVSSINWNENSPTRNREIGIVIEGSAADYFAAVFNYDFYPKNRITGLATARNYMGIGLVVLIAIFFLWMRKRQTGYRIDAATNYDK